MKRNLTKLAEQWKGAGNYRYALLVLVLGALLMLVPSGRGSEERTPERNGTAHGSDFDLEQFEKRLAATLSEVEGAGKVQVLLTLDSGSEQIVAQDLEREPEGSGSSTVVTVSQGGGRETVVPLQTMAPQFRGALVVCPGGLDPGVRLELTRAVTVLTGLRSDQIAVCTGRT